MANMKTQIGSIVRPCFNGSTVKLPSRPNGINAGLGVPHLVVAIYRNPSFPKTSNPDTPMVGLLALPINPAMHNKIEWHSSWVLVQERAEETSSMNWLNR